MQEPNDLKQRPIVFVHGAWHGAWCWDEWITVFRREGYTNTIAVELRGHGYKVGSFKHARLENYIEDVQTIINNLDAEPILIGHSLGCSIIQHLCSQRRFPAAVLVAPIPKRSIFIRVFFKQLFRHPIIAGQSIFKRNMSPWVTSKVTPKLFFSPRMLSRKAREYTDRMQGESFRMFILDLLKDAAKPKTGTPMLVAAAEEDKFFSVADQKKTAQNIQADFLAIGNSGHDVMLDVFNFQAAEEIIGWLKANEQEKQL